jgi:1,4-alpha-glucan branching enzyme
MTDAQVGATALEQAFERLVRGTHDDPFAVLGPHRIDTPGGGALAVRTCQPHARRVDLIRRDREAAPIPMQRRHPDGVFEAIVAEKSEPFEYRLRIFFDDGRVVEVDDPYRYGPVLGELDLHLFGEGRHLRLYEKLGARPARPQGARGYSFAVWAPTAERVSLVGDFNRWDGRVHPMRRRDPSGVWELFVPDVDRGERYKFEIRSRLGGVFLKTDPYGLFFDPPPEAAAITWSLDEYVWHDEPWRRARAALGGWLDRPMSIYEVHLGSWARVPEEGRRPLTYRELAERLIPYAKAMGFTHLELLPVMEHPFGGSWGYQVSGFFAPTSRFGPPEDFKYFIDRCHQHGLGVLLDWPPAHFPRDAFALARFDGSALYEHEDPRLGEHPDWGTLVFNYGRHEVRNFLLASALFWLDVYHADGLRVDAVASMLYLDYSRRAGEWLPNRYGGRENLEAIELLRELNILTHREHPGSVTVAEESTAWPGVSRPVYLGGLGFTYKWNLGWMHDMLDYVGRDPVHRKWHHGELTFSLLYAFHENFVLPLSHDEVVHGKRSLVEKLPGDDWQKFATLRALYGYMYAHPGKKLLFMGNEFGQRREWAWDESLDWHLLGEGPFHVGVQRWVRDLNELYCREPALHQVDFDPAGFEWIDCHDADSSVVSFLRRARNPRDTVVVVVNFTPVVRVGYRIGVPEAGFYRELLNSDSIWYGGGNVGNAGGVWSEPVPAHGHPQSLALTLPPLACLLLARRP